MITSRQTEKQWGNNFFPLPYLSNQISIMLFPSAKHKLQNYCDSDFIHILKPCRSINGSSAVIFKLTRIAKGGEYLHI